MRINKTSTLDNPVLGIRTENSKPFITAIKDPLWIKAFDRMFEMLIKKSFYSIRIKNADNFYLRNNNYSNLIYGFHSCWWDGPVAYYLCRSLFDVDFYMMVEDLYRFPALSKLGAFSVEKCSPQESIKALKYSIKLLKNPKNTLWLFPQGRVMPPDSRPIKFESGLTYMCNKLKGVNLIPVACRYTYLREDKPEIFIEIGEPKIIENEVVNKKELLKCLECDFTRLLDNQRLEISSGDLENYQLIYENKKCWIKQLERVLHPILRLNV